MLIRANDITAKHLEPLEILGIETAVLHPNQKNKDPRDEKDKAEEMMNHLGPVGKSKDLLEDIQGSEHKTKTRDHTDHAAYDNTPMGNLLNGG